VTIKIFILHEEVEHEPEAVLEVSHIDQVNIACKVIEAEETSDYTIGPGDCRSSDSESSEEESEIEEVVKLIPVVIPAKPVALKPTSPTIARKIVPVSPLYRKVMPSPPSPPARSSWSKFLPLVIEIKATIPSMHLLGLTLLVVVGLLLRLLYEFGADLGGDIDFSGQLIRLAKLGVLFFVAAMCVNFVEDNKKLPHKDPISSAQPKLRPSKMTKNKKKMMMKV